MDHTCREAYSIYNNHVSLTDDCGNKVIYLNKILETISKRTNLGIISLLPVVLYAEKSIAVEKLSIYQKGLLVNTLSSLNIQCCRNTRNEIEALIKRLIVSIMDN
tara:strand:+ start:4135 stop:4449 length:315 start_codon:yes stop_codon:yes gene_type:complete